MLASRKVIAASVLLFIAALPWSATYYERVTHPGYLMLLLGFLGPIILQLGWYANPLLGLAWIFGLLGNPRRARARRGLAIAATVLAASSFITLLDGASMIGKNEGESAGTFNGFGPAIFLWFAAILLELAAASAAARLAAAPSAPAAAPT